MQRRIEPTRPSLVLAVLLVGAAAVAGSLTASRAVAQPYEGYAYHRSAELMVSYGTQALMLCNGLFVSERTLDQVYAQELMLDRMPLLPPSQVEIDPDRRTVAVGVGGIHPVPTMRAAYRPGLGCMVMAPDQSFAAVDSLPELTLAPMAGDPSELPWPDGDLVPEIALPDFVDAGALAAAGDYAFDLASHGHPYQVTLSMMVVHEGKVIYEAYAPGVDYTTRTRTWSTAKSIAGTLIGIAVEEGLLELDAPLPFDEWGPAIASDDADPRRAITLRDVLHMSSGLYPVDNQLCAVVGSCLSYFAGSSSVRGALDRGLVREPGTYWDYENYDTLLALYALKKALGSEQAYLEYPRKALFDKIGMRNTVPGADRFGNYVMSSQVYTNARDLARFGLLFLNRGTWNDTRIVPESWVDFVRTPAPSTLDSGAFYGGQWWLVPDDRTDVPADAYSTAGNRGQHVVVIPSYDLVIVRRGLDWQPGVDKFDQWDLTREVLKAFPDRPWGEKPEPEPQTQTQTGSDR